MPVTVTLLFPEEFSLGGLPRLILDGSTLWVGDKSWLRTGENSFVVFAPN